MKIFNITDAATSALDARGLSKQAIKVGDTVIEAGGSATIRGTARERSELQVYIKVGAIALDELPPAYAARRGLKLDGSPVAPPAPEPAAPKVAEAFAEPIQEDPLEGVPKRKGSK